MLRSLSSERPPCDRWGEEYADYLLRSHEEIEEECCVGREDHDDGEDMSAEETLALGAVALLAGKDLLSWLAGGLEHGL